MESAGPLRVRDWHAGGGGRLVKAGPSGLLADGRPVGAVWRLGGSGIVEVERMRYRGELEFRSIPNGMQVINKVTLEDYVAGILGREIYPDWHPETLKAQARRMLKDDRVRGLAVEFCANWLDVRRFEKHNAVDRHRFPSFDDSLRRAMFEEPVRFFMDMAQNDRQSGRYWHAYSLRSSCSCCRSY